MTTQEKCEAIVRKIAEMGNRGAITFESDLGLYSLTVIVEEDDKKGHTHVGIPDPDGDFDLLVGGLYNTLHGGPGLSWFPQVPDAVK